MTLLLEDQSLDPAMVQLMLQLPSEAQLHEEAADDYHVQAITGSRNLSVNDCRGLQEAGCVYQRHNIEQVYAPVADQIGRRALKNAALSYLMLVDNIGVIWPGSSLTMPTI